jgi:hypothetical protein
MSAEPNDEQRNPVTESDKKEIDSATALVQALGGSRGLLDSGLPALVFVLTNTITRDLMLSGVAAVSLAGVLAVIRIVKRDTLQHAFTGFFGVAICVFLARQTGEARDFYLPGLFINFVYALAYIAGNLLRWPIFGLLIGSILGEGTTWRNNPDKLRLYQRIGWIWAGMFVVRFAVQAPLYLANEETWLGIARVAMGWPLFLLTGAASWRLLRRG